MRTAGLRQSGAVVATGCIVAAMVVSGCTIGRYYVGTPLRAVPTDLVEGRSTKHDVLQLLGPPTQIMHETDGDAFVYTYQQTNTSSFRVQDPISSYNWFTYSRQLENRDRLLVLFDFTGVVRSVSIDHRVEDMPLL